MEGTGTAYTVNGIVIPAGIRLYTSVADTHETIDDAFTCFEKVFRRV